MGALASLFQQINSTACNHFAAMTQEVMNQLLQIENLRLTVDQCHNVDTKHALQLSLREEVIKNHFTNIGALNFDNNAQTVFIRLITELGDTFKLFLFDQLGDALNQACLVQLVGNFGNDNGLATSLFVHFNARFCPHIDTSAASTIGLNNSRSAIDNTGSGEIRPWNIFHQLIDGNLRIVDHRQTTFDHFSEVMGRNIGRHAHSNTRGTIN